MAGDWSHFSVTVHRHESKKLEAHVQSLFVFAPFDFRFACEPLYADSCRFSSFPRLRSQMIVSNLLQGFLYRLSFDRALSVRHILQASFRMLWMVC